MSNKHSRNFTVFHSKQLTDKQRVKFNSKYCTYSYKKGDLTFVVVCHGKGEDLNL